MHDTARMTGKLFMERYWKPEFKRILDIGSMDVNGTLRDHCPPGADYIGVDLSPGRGVDVVLESPYKFPFPIEHFDLIVSTSCFEHDSCFWLTFNEALRVLSLEGAFYISAPSNGVYHAYPRDNWRFYPDSGLALKEWAWHSSRPCNLIESFIAPRSADGWEDTVMVFSKVAWDARLAGEVKGHRDFRREATITHNYW